MKDLIIDERLRSQLKGLKEEVAVRDESGVPIAYIVPHQLYQKLMYAYCGEPPFTPEEIERRIQDNSPGRSTAEVLKRLGAT